MKRLVLCMMVVLAASIARATGYVTVGDFKFFVDTYAGEASVAKYVGDGGDVVVPASVKMDGVSYPVTSLGEKCFAGCEKLVSVQIQGPVKTFGQGCFMNSGLHSIQIPSSVVTIESSCFMSCIRLGSIQIPSSVTSIGWRCFKSCSNLTSVRIPSSVTSLTGGCFENCHRLSSIEIPSSVVSLGENCFYHCDSLSSIQIPSSVVSIDSYCFYTCGNLSSIQIPESVEFIGACCFAYSGLTSVNIPKSVKCLGPECFEGAYNLKTANISANISSLPYSLFNSCSELESLSLSEYIKSYERGYSNTFLGCESLSELKAYSVDPIDFGNDIPSNCVLVVPAESVEAYQKVNPGRKVYPLKGSDLGTGKQCGLPVVSYANGQLHFSCTTPGANYHYKIVASDACDQTYSQDGIVKLSAKYDISVYATAEGYIPSETVDATLVWLDAKVKGTGVSSISVPDKRAVITSAHDGVLTVSGLNEGEEVAFYSVDGKRIGGQKAVDGVASLLIPNIATSNIVIVRIGEQSIKVMMK